MINLHE